MLFFKKFLKHGTRVASVAPSSPALAKAMCRHVDAAAPQVIVELGAGTGAVTRFIQQRMHPQSTLIAVEIDPDFAEVLRRQAPKAQVMVCDVAELTERLREQGIEKVDRMLSGLPTPSLPKTVNQAVLDGYRELAAEDGMFTQLTVMPWVYKPLYDRLFEQVDFDLAVLNIPPGGAYHCQGLKADYQQHLPGK